MAELRVVHRSYLSLNSEFTLLNHCFALSAHFSDLVRACDQLPPGDGLAAGLVQDGAVGDAGLGPGHTAQRALLGPAHSEILCINILKKR